MKLETRLFGVIDYEANDVITFPNGLPSFEEEHSFLLLPLSEHEAGPFCLQSVSTPALTFVLMNPFSICPSYAPRLRSDEREALRVTRDEDLCFYVLCAMKRPVGSSTVNLKCPIALNPDSRIAYQIILETDTYHMRHPLADFSNSEEEPSC